MNMKRLATVVIITLSTTAVAADATSKASYEAAKKEAATRFKLLGNEFLEEAFLKEHGVVLVISHLGSWEYLSFLPYFTKRPWSVVVKNIKNPYVDKAIDAMRRVMTVNPISKDNSVRAIFQELKAGHGVAILVDQWAGDDGLWVDFFDTKTSTTSIPARLSEKTGCALVSAYCLHFIRSLATSLPRLPRRLLA